MQQTMGNKESTTSKSGGAVKAEQSSVHSKGATPVQRITVQMVQNVLLIWLDNNIDDTSNDCRNTIIQLRRVINNIIMFTDADQCVDFLTNIDNENACMIISGALCQTVVPLIHDVSHLYTIFIFCDNNKYHEQWAKEWPKIRGVFTKITLICEAVKKAARQCEQNTIPMSFMATSDDVSNKKLDQLDPSFMYTQILKEILLTIKFEQQHITEFINYCREQLVGNDPELSKLNRFEEKYHDETPIWWYTCEYFLYSMLNRTLRLMDMNVIIKIGFFIADLHRHIEQLHNEQFTVNNSNKSITVYRGQGMSKADFEQLTKTKGGLISFNNFLSTSKRCDVSLLFAESIQSNPDVVGILFVIIIDPSLPCTPFASIDSISQFQVEEEVLFAMHTVFRIGEITPMDENHRLFRVELTLTSDNDPDLRRLTDHIREETFPDAEGWYRLGQVLVKMGQPKKAQQVYEILLEQETEESRKAPIYNQLGWVKLNQGEYTEAIPFFEKSIEMYKKTLPPNHPSLAIPYNNIGLVYSNMGDYSKALLSHEKALAIRQQSLPPNHPDLGMSYNNIGVVYDNMGDYSKALSSHEKALAIRQQSLPPNHPDLGGSYNNIGNVYDSMGDYSKALSYYEKALAIEQQSLPPNHPDLGMSYNNIGNVYFNMADYSKALSSHEKALAIRQQSLPPNHPDVGTSYNNIGMVYDCMGGYSKALSSHEKALAIRQQSLPPNHPDLGASYDNIGNVYFNMGDCSKALSSYENALAIKQQSLPPSHPDFGMSYNNIGNVYFSMGDYSKARSFYERAVKIAQQSLPSNHPNRQMYRENLDIVKKKL